MFHLDIGKMRVVKNVFGWVIITIVCCYGCATPRFTDCFQENLPRDFWTVQLTDNLPANSPKGYVEIYAAQGNSLGSLHFPLYQVIDNKENFVGNVCSCNGYTRRRVACMPGTYLYSILGGSVIKPFEVVVKEGMITPVRLNFIELSHKTFLTSGNYNYKREIKFRIETRIEDPLCIEQHDANLVQSYYEKLSSSDLGSVHFNSIFLTAQYSIGGTNFSVLHGNFHQVAEAREFLHKASMNLDLTKEGDKREFLKRYQTERRNHPNLQHLLFLSPTIDGL